MKERPILFSGPMVRAILEGRKTQTRRVMNTHGVPADEYAASLDLLHRPYCQPGDRLWVRETWAAHWMWDDVKPSEIAIDAGTCKFWRADDASFCCGDTRTEKNADLRGRWRPSIHMPRGFSRITLEVTAVRVERLQDIKEYEARAEGVRPGKVLSDRHGNPFRQDITRLAPLKLGTYRGEFIALWNSLNEKRGHGWDTNPWVWVVEFKVAT